ncbi:MAG: hypothetical protein ABSC47_10440 [Terracidiphilus sp.]|jgi:hypothetical protein
MNEDDIRKEIEERRKLAKNLKLRELLWTLYYYGLSQYPEYQTKDPELILPEIKDSLSIENDHFRFLFGDVEYEIIYAEGKKETDSWGSRRWEDEIETTPVTITLKVDDKCVFSFDMKRTVQNTREMPLFDERMGEVKAYIPGPWLAAIIDLRQKIDQHKKSIWGKRQAPRRAQQLKEDMKRFGL